MSVNITAFKNVNYLPCVYIQKIIIKHVMELRIQQPWYQWIFDQFFTHFFLLFIHSSIFDLLYVIVFSSILIKWNLFIVNQKYDWYYNWVIFWQCKQMNCAHTYTRLDLFYISTIWNKIIDVSISDDAAIFFFSTISIEMLTSSWKVVIIVQHFYWVWYSFIASTLKKQCEIFCRVWQMIDFGTIDVIKEEGNYVPLQNDTFRYKNVLDCTNS